LAFTADQFRVGLTLTPNSQSLLILRYPHPAFLAPDVVGLPEFDPDGKVASGFRYEELFIGMGNIDPRDDIDLLGDPLVHQDAVADLHGARAFFRIIISCLHGEKLIPSGARTG
jgi:hypothetical protein